MCPTAKAAWTVMHKVTTHENEAAPCRHPKRTRVVVAAASTCGHTHGCGCAQLPQQQLRRLALRAIGAATRQSRAHPKRRAPARSRRDSAPGHGAAGASSPRCTTRPWQTPAARARPSRWPQKEPDARRGRGRGGRYQPPTGPLKGTSRVAGPWMGSACHDRSRRGVRARRQPSVVHRCGPRASSGSSKRGGIVA